MTPALKNICFIYKDFYDMLHNVTADPACDLTRLYRHSLEDHIKGTQHICVITNGSSSLHEAMSSVIRSDFISQVPRITMPGRHWMGTLWGEGGGLARAKTQKR